MNETQIPAGAVVAGFDGSEDGTRALTWAARLAHDEGRPLVVLYAVGTPEADRMIGLADAGFDREQVIGHLTRAGREMVHHAASGLGGRHPGIETHEVVTVRDPRQALLDAARAGASTVVVGSHGRGPLLSVLLGSVSATLARFAACPVVVVRPHHPGRVRHGVLVGSDGTESSTPVVEAAFRIASERSLPLTVSHVLWGSVPGTESSWATTFEPADTEEARLLVSESLAGLREKYPDVPVAVRFADGAPWQQLVTDAQAMDLLVVGRHDHGLLDRLVRGSTTIAVVEHASCPVLVVPVGTTPRT